MKLLRSNRHSRVSKAAFAAALLLLAAGVDTHAQTSILNASYGPSGNLGPQTGSTFTLNTFTVTGVYTAGSATSVTIFVTDGTANGRIFGTQTALAGLTTGVQATATVTNSVFQATEELKTPTGITLASTTATVTPATASLSQVAATVNNGSGTNVANPFTQGPNDSLYASEGSLLLAPVSFTIIPTTTGTLSTTGTTTLTDLVTGDTVSLYKAASALAYTTGIPETITGFEQPFTPTGSTTLESEIVGTYAVPEPATVLGGVLLVVATAWSQRRRLGGVLGRTA